jgi:DNA-binding sugar fermentation-stimulating protein
MDFIHLPTKAPSNDGLSTMAGPDNDQDQVLTASPVPPFSVFREQIKKIYPEGDLDKTYKRILWYIENEKFCADGTPITYQFIMAKYAAHIKGWNLAYATRDSKYLSREAEEKRKTLWEFIALKWYEREFVTQTGLSERHNYLFSSFSPNYLREQLDNFRKGFKDEAV